MWLHTVKNYQKNPGIICLETTSLIRIKTLINNGAGLDTTDYQKHHTLLSEEKVHDF